ncbi:MAG: hypothetical protein KDB86_07920 [Actinobacteria bacterium]|nr:hypothetical protein [Actinomycetota bacterium]MCB9388602.1 hypothetical protein [Acidimicrobiia bacterium]
MEPHINLPARNLPQDTTRRSAVAWQRLGIDYAGSASCVSGPGGLALLEGALVFDGRSGGVHIPLAGAALMPASIESASVHVCSNGVAHEWCLADHRWRGLTAVLMGLTFAALALFVDSIPLGLCLAFGALTGVAAWFATTNLAIARAEPDVVEVWNVLARSIEHAGGSVPDRIFVPVKRLRHLTVSSAAAPAVPHTH